MTDEELIARLRELGDHASFEPHMHHKAADRIEDLVERNKELALQLLATQGQAAEAKLATCERHRDAYAEMDRIGTQAVRDLEAKLEKAVEALELIVVDNTWGLEHQTYMKCRKALAEIKSGVATTPYGLEGESHD